MDDQNQNPGNDDTGTGDGSGAWLEGLSDELKGDETLKGMESVESLAKAHVDLTKSFGDLKGSQPVIPESPDKYELTIPADAQVDQEDLKGFRTLAHGLKIPQEVASKLIEFDLERHQRAEKSLNDRIKTEMGKAEKALKDAWKDDYDGNLAVADRAVEKFGGKELVEYLGNSGLGRQPMVVRTFCAIGKAMSEDTFKKGDETKELERTEAGTPMLDFPSMKTE